eukprot:1159026-Pelagomonas_calceolata.AAC.1
MSGHQSRLPPRLPSGHQSRLQVLWASRIHSVAPSALQGVRPKSLTRLYANAMPHAAGPLPFKSNFGHEETDAAFLEHLRRTAAPLGGERALSQEEPVDRHSAAKLQLQEQHVAKVQGCSCMRVSVCV